MSVETYGFAPLQPIAGVSIGPDGFRVLFMGNNFEVDLSPLREAATFLAEKRVSLPYRMRLAGMAAKVAMNLWA